MADIIQLLPDSVANQIAAGEVIQRPSSVIKELMENSVDAGATSIDVWVTDAGKTSIRVVDNGKGMSETDARLAFERHATSKIRQASDLFALRTMGFRGEALPSIAAVAQVTLKTRTKDDELGVQLSIEGSRIKEQSFVACNVGTQFLVDNLFFNVPARRRFLKSNPTELNNIMAEFERVALIHPEISFTLHRDDALVLDLRPSTFRKRITSMFGANLDKQLLPINVETSIVKIDGFVGTPESARIKGAKQFFFVNQRYMRHPYFNRAIVSAFERLISSDKQVPYFCCLDVDPSRIDVNIHPTKTEIKFEDDLAIWQILQVATKEALGRFNAVPVIDFYEGSSIPEIPSFNPKNVPSSIPDVKIDKTYTPFQSEGKFPKKEVFPRKEFVDGWEELYATIRKTSSSAVNASPVSNGDEPNERLLYSNVSETDKKTWNVESAPTFMQYKDTYILYPADSGLMIIDQHRAHVRVLYEKYMGQIENDIPVSQGLIFPELIQIPASQLILFNEYLSDFESFGFDIENVGGGSFAINGVPIDTDSQDSTKLLMDIFEGLQSKESLSKEKIYYKIALSLARKNAIKDGQMLSELEIGKLLEDLFATSTPKYTPDGTPVYFLLEDSKLVSSLGL